MLVDAGNGSATVVKDLLEEVANCVHGDRDARIRGLNDAELGRLLEAVQAKLNRCQAIPDASCNQATASDLPGGGAGFLR